MSRTAPSRNLVLVHQETCQDVRDFEAIAAHVRALAPDIETFIVDNERRSPVTTRKAAERPTLIVSPGALDRFRPARGRIYAGRPISKAEQMRLFAAAGVPVPETAELTPGFKADPAIFGPYVIVKPGHVLASKSRGMTIMRTQRVRFRPPQDYPAGHPGRFGPMLVQRYIDTGERLTHARVLTLFGEPLLATDVMAEALRPALDLSDAELERLPVQAKQTEGFVRRLVYDDDILTLARRAYEALPDVPLQGCDIVRERETGRLYLLEVNPGGNTWFFSNPLARDVAAGVGLADLTRQFDGFRTAARVLVEHTRTEAT